MSSGMSDNNKCPGCGQDSLFRDFDCSTGEVYDRCMNCNYSAGLCLRLDAYQQPVRQAKAAYPINGSLVIAAVDPSRKLVTFEEPLTGDMKKGDILRLLKAPDGNDPRSVYLKENGEYERVLNVLDDFFLQQDDKDGMMLFAVMKAIYDIHLLCLRSDGVTISIFPFSPADVERLTASGLNGDYIAQDHYLVRAKGSDGPCEELYLERRIVEEVGALYVVEHAVLDHNEDGASTLNVDLHPYYNSVERFPPKTVTVEFIKEIPGEGKEVYRSLETGRYYQRIPSPRESFARWVSCHGPRLGFMDKARVRANITFRHGAATETVSWYRWNGNGVYDDQFSPGFRKGCSQ